VLAKFASDQWMNLSVSTKKNSVTEAVQLWRLLQFCDRSNNAKQTVDRLLKLVEGRRDWFRQDLEKNRRDHFLKRSVKNIRQYKILSHLWIYAIENAEDDLFRSMTMIETLIARTTSLQGLHTPSKLEQISLLELNAVGVFSALSLRYNHILGASAIALVIPEKSYLQCYILGGGSRPFRGFGVPLKDVLMSACHKNFFDCFSICVNHLEFLARTIIKNDLLGLPPKPNPQDIERFERAFILGSFIGCNAVAFSITGLDMTPGQVQDDPTAMPSVPLSGNIASLIRKLKETTTYTNVPPRLQRAFKKLDENATCLDLMEGTNILLEEIGFSDELIFCRLKEASPISCEVGFVHDISQITSVLRSAPFHDKRGVFLTDYKPSSQQFLRLGLRKNPGDDVVENFSRETDERNAASMIARNWRSRKRETNGEACSSTKCYFRVWKYVMCRFVKIAKDRMQKTLQSRAGGRDVEMHRRLDEALRAIPNYWSDSLQFQNIVEKWRQTYLSSLPVFDGIECGYCNIVFAYPQREHRIQWCQANCSDMTYNLAAQRYNLVHYKTPVAPSAVSCYGLQSFENHGSEAFHAAHVAQHRAFYQQVTDVAAHLDISFMTIGGIVQVCDRQSQHGPSRVSSWYENIGDEARSWHPELEMAHLQLTQEGLVWPPSPNFQVLMASLGSTCRRVQAFFEDACVEEARRLEDTSDDDETAEEVQDNDGAFSHPLADFHLDL
jgi:hypothetical protein